jgi:hypothetical protein
MLIVFKFFFLENKVINYLARCDFVNAAKDINQCISLLDTYQEHLYPYRFHIHLLIGIYANMVGQHDLSLQHLEYVENSTSKNVRTWAMLYSMITRLSTKRPPKHVINEIFDELAKIEDVDYTVKAMKLLIRAILCTHNNAPSEAIKYATECSTCLDKYVHNKQMSAQCQYLLGVASGKMDSSRKMDALEKSLELSNAMGDIIGQFHTINEMQNDQDTSNDLQRTIAENISLSKELTEQLVQVCVSVHSNN